MFLRLNENFDDRTVAATENWVAFHRLRTRVHPLPKCSSTTNGTRNCTRRYTDVHVNSNRQTKRSALVIGIYVRRCLLARDMAGQSVLFGEKRDLPSEPLDTLHRYFERAVSADNRAAEHGLRFGDSRRCYAEVNECANAVARIFCRRVRERQTGLEKDAVVVVDVEPCDTLIVVLLAIVKVCLLLLLLLLFSSSSFSSSILSSSSSNSSTTSYILLLLFFYPLLITFSSFSSSSSNFFYSLLSYSSSLSYFSSSFFFFFSHSHCTLFHQERCTGRKLLHATFLFLSNVSRFTTFSLLKKVLFSFFI